MIASSFMPAVTQMIYDMGLDHLLNGITFECPKQALEEKDVAVRYKLEGQDLTSEEINRIFSKSKATGESLYYIDEKIIEKISPDVVFTQDVCDVCQIDTACAEVSLFKLPKAPEIISISPNSLEDVFDNALTIASAMGYPQLGAEYVGKLRTRIANIVDQQRAARSVPKSVMLLEWINPLFNGGHWIPHQIGYAGGIDLLSHPSGDSIVIDWGKIVKYDPEVLVIAPCGYSMEKTKGDMQYLENKAEWASLKAVKSNQVYIADFDLFTQSSASSLVEGIQVLAKIFHPDIFKEQTGLEHKYKNYFEFE